MKLKVGIFDSGIGGFTILNSLLKTRTDVVLEVSKIVKKLLSEKGVKARLTRKNEVNLDLPPRVSFANSLSLIHI